MDEQLDQQPAATPTPRQPHQPGGMSLHTLRYSKTAPEPLASSPLTPPQDEMGRPSEARWLIYLKTVGVFGLVFCLVLVALVGPAWYRRVSYTLKTDSVQAPQQLAYLPKLQEAPIQLLQLKDKPADYFDTNVQIPGYSLADLGDNQLLIPKIQVKVPIVWGSEADEASILTSLQRGVAHYGFTAYPDQGQGNVFLSGHSSYFFWDKGQYKTIFANLDRLVAGDQVAVTYHETVYIYQVREKKVVKPTDFDVTNATATPTLSLMTCVPVGTNLNRLVVQADLISAAPTIPVRATPASLKNAPSIFSYLPF